MWAPFLFRYRLAGLKPSWCRDTANDVKGGCSSLTPAAWSSLRGRAGATKRRGADSMRSDEDRQCWGRAAMGPRSSRKLCHRTFAPSCHYELETRVDSSIVKVGWPLPPDGTSQENCARVSFERLENKMTPPNPRRLRVSHAARSHLIAPLFVSWRFLEKQEGCTRRSVVAYPCPRRPRRSI